MNSTRQLVSRLFLFCYGAFLLITVDASELPEGYDDQSFGEVLVETSVETRVLEEQATNLVNASFENWLMTKHLPWKKSEAFYMAALDSYVRLKVTDQKNLLWHIWHDMALEDLYPLVVDSLLGIHFTTYILLQEKSLKEKGIFSPDSLMVAAEVFLHDSIITDKFKKIQALIEERYQEKGYHVASLCHEVSEELVKLCMKNLLNELNIIISPK